MLFGWLQDPSDSQLESYLTPWMSRMLTQDDYNAVVDFLALHLNDSTGHVVIDGLVRDVVRRREDFPRIGQQSWDWAQLALRLAQRDPYYVAELLLDLIDADAVVGYESSHEYEVLRAALKSSGSRAWSEAMNRIEAGSWRLALTTKHADGLLLPSILKLLRNGLLVDWTEPDSWHPSHLLVTTGCRILADS